MPEHWHRLLPILGENTLISGCTAPVCVQQLAWDITTMQGQPCHCSARSLVPKPPAGHIPVLVRGNCLCQENLWSQNEQLCFNSFAASTVSCFTVTSCTPEWREEIFFLEVVSVIFLPDTQKCTSRAPRRRATTGTWIQLHQQSGCRAAPCRNHSPIAKLINGACPEYLINLMNPGDKIRGRLIPCPSQRRAGEAAHRATATQTHAW